MVKYEIEYSTGDITRLSDGCRVSRMPDGAMVRWSHDKWWVQAVDAPGQVEEEEIEEG